MQPEQAQPQGYRRIIRKQPMRPLQPVTLPIGLTLRRGLRGAV